MISRLFRKPRRPSKLFTRQRKFTHERLEPRVMLTINLSGDEFLVNDEVPGIQDIENNVSSVAVSEAAGTLVTYSGRGAATRESIFLRRYDSAGEAQDVVRASETTRGSRSDAVVAANATGSSVVVWHGQGPGDKHGIFMQRFNAAGDFVGDETLVNETTAGTQFDPDVAMAADGSFVVTWSGPTADDPSGILARRFDSDGVAEGSEVQVNTTTAGHQTESSIGMSSAGSYVIIWTSEGQDGDSRGIFGQRFNSAGETQGDEFQVNTETAGPQQESSVAMQSDGTFMAVWSSFDRADDRWSIVGQRFDATGTALGDEITVNTTTAGQHRHPQVGGTFGSYLVTWQLNLSDGSGWEVLAQEFDSSGARVGTEITVNAAPAGTNSGHQQHPAVGFSAAGQGAVVWSGHGTADRQGVFAVTVEDDQIREDNLTPDLAEIPAQTVEAGTELVVVVTATDPNAGDTLTFQLDPTSSPADATITRNESDPRSATIRWTPTADLEGTTVEFLVTVTDNGEPALADAEAFTVEVVDDSFRLDLNGPNEIGTDAAAQFAIGLGPASILDDSVTIDNANNDEIFRASIVLTETPDGGRETLSVDTTGTNIVASYNQFLRRLFLTHSGSTPETAANYERVLSTLTYDNTSDTPSGATRTVAVQVNDSGFLSNRPTITIDLVSAENLVELASALEAAGAQFFGASWSQATADQRALFEDGGQSLPFTEVTNADRTLNDAVAGPNNITDPEVPVWIFDDDTRLEGVQTPEALAAQIGISVPLSVDPTFAEVPDQTVLIGSPLHVSLDGYDPTGGRLTYTVTTDRPDLIEARILEGNRSARVQVEGYGDMVFELFEQRASRATDRFIQLASDDLFNDGLANEDFFYDDVIFHRVINDFVIQGGDPDGTGSGGTGVDFDDQFHIDLQHNRTGLLSFAKSLEDTNDSQFFITEGASASLRNLDFHHSIFGVLVEGEMPRAAISDTSVIREQSDVTTNPVDPTDIFPGDPRLDRPGVRETGEEFNITMSNVEIFEDHENAVLLLKANSSADVGDVIAVTVTVEDEQGNTHSQTFDVTLAADTVNGRPFLDDVVAPETVDAGSTFEFQLTAQDVENDALFFRAETPAGNTVPYDATVDSSGLVTIELTDSTTGELQIDVMVAAAESDFEFGVNEPVSRRDGRIDRQSLTIEVV